MHFPMQWHNQTQLYSSWLLYNKNFSIISNTNFQHNTFSNNVCWILHSQRHDILYYNNDLIVDRIGWWISIEWLIKFSLFDLIITYWKMLIVRLNLINHFVSSIPCQFACNLTLRNPIFMWESCKGNVWENVKKCSRLCTEARTHD